MQLPVGKKQALFPDPQSKDKASIYLTFVNTASLFRMKASKLQYLTFTPTAKFTIKMQRCKEVKNIIFV